MQEAFSIRKNSGIETKTEVDDRISIASGNIDNALLESIWKELNGRVDRGDISLVNLEAKARYHNAAIKTYLPIFIQRYVLERLE